MKINSIDLLNELEAVTMDSTRQINSLLSFTPAQLNCKPGPQSWSILECLEHLNRYSAFYLPQIAKAIAAAPEATPYFKSGYIGNYLVKMVVPKPDAKKMKTFAAMNPHGQILGNEALQQCIKNQEQLLQLIVKAKTVNTNHSGIPVTFTRFIKLKVGDALRFMVYHNQRHVQQAMRIKC